MGRARGGSWKCGHVEYEPEGNWRLKHAEDPSLPNHHEDGVIGNLINRKSGLPSLPIFEFRVWDEKTQKRGEKKEGRRNIVDVIECTTSSYYVSASHWLDRRRIEKPSTITVPACPTLGPFLSRMTTSKTHSLSPRRFAILKAGNAPDYAELTYGGFPKMVEVLLKDGGGQRKDDDDEREEETWDTFSVLEGDFSFLDRRDFYDGYVITGSLADAHADGVDWILTLCDAIRMLYDEKKRLLGICFGHQVLARALGGKTGRALGGWDLGLRRLCMDSRVVTDLYGFHLGSQLHAIKCHQDQVSEVPPGAVVLASSEKTSIEIFALDDNVLAVQGHPEFTDDVFIDIIQTILSKQIITKEIADEAIQSLEDKEADCETLKQLCKLFLKRKSVEMSELDKKN